VPTVKFFIRDGQDRNQWKLVVRELEKRGHKVLTHHEPCDTAIVLSGLFTNPSLFKRSYLFMSKKEWGNMWGNMYGPILSNYYTVIFECSAFNLEQIVGLLCDTHDSEMELLDDSSSVLSKNGVKHTRKMS
jgi:hypothetical protein